MQKVRTVWTVRTVMIDDGTIRHAELLRQTHQPIVVDIQKVHAKALKSAGRAAKARLRARQTRLQAAKLGQRNRELRQEVRQFYQ
jgi:hypothetical protein